MNRSSHTQTSRGDAFQMRDVVVVAPVIIAWLAIAMLQIDYEGFAAIAGIGVATLAAGALALAEGVRSTPSYRRTIYITTVPIAVMLVSALLARNVPVSLAGMLGSAHGATMWAAAWAVMVGTALLAEEQTIHLATRVVALLGTASGGRALVEAAGLIERQGAWSAEPSGLLVDSAALGMFQLLAVACAASWYLSTDQRTKERWFALACGVVTALGLAVSVSRSAWVAGILGTLLVMSLAERPIRRPAVRRTLWILVLASVVILVVGAILLSIRGPADATFVSANRLLNDRPLLWRSAWLQFLQDPVIGAGPSQFGAYYDWSPDPELVHGVNTVGSFSTHGILFSWLNGAGVLGLAALLSGFAAWGLAVVPTVTRDGDPRKAILLGGLFAWALAACFSIVGIVSLTGAALVAGALLAQVRPSLAMAGSNKPRAGPDLSGSRALPAALIASGVFAFAVMFTPLSVAPDALQLPERIGPEDVVKLEAAYARTGDPTYAAMALKQLLAYTGDEDYEPEIARDAQRVAAAAARDADWRIDVARYGYAAWFLEPAPADARAHAAEMLEAGHHADPASGLWDYLAKRDGIAAP